MKKLVLIICLLPLQLLAQGLQAFEPFEAGDVVTYTVNVNGTPKKLEYTYANVDKNGASGKVVFGDKEGDFLNPSLGVEEKDFALSNGQMMVRKPFLKVFDANLQVGHKLNQVFEVSSDVLTVQIIQQAVATKAEKVKLKFGEVDSILITNNDVLQGITNKAEVFSGKSNAKVWVGVVSNRALVVRREYQNSFGEKVVQELIEPPRVSDVQKKLEKLKDLHKQGLINDAEYEIKKKDLLKKL